MVWDVAPEIFSIGIFSSRWYGTLFTIAFVVGYFILRKIFRQEAVPLRKLNRLTCYVAMGTIVGARLGHCLFYETEYFLQNPLEMFFPIVRDVNGAWQFVGYQGLASHGAAIGILAALYVYARVERLPFLWTVDRIVIVVALSGFFIRMGNLMNSEIYGQPTNLPWGFDFVRSPEWYRPPINAQSCHPTQIYEALAYLAVFVLLAKKYFRNKEKLKTGLLTAIFLVSVFTMRFLIEFLKIEQVPFEKDMTLNMGQLLSIPFIIAGVVGLCRL